MKNQAEQLGNSSNNNNIKNNNKIGGPNQILDYNCHQITEKYGV